jgi:hypothetical protein
MLARGLISVKHGAVAPGFIGHSGQWRRCTVQSDTTGGWYKNKFDHRCLRRCREHGAGLWSNLWLCDLREIYSDSVTFSGFNCNRSIMSLFYLAGALRCSSR